MVVVLPPPGGKTTTACSYPSPFPFCLHQKPGGSRVFDGKNRGCDCLTCSREGGGGGEGGGGLGVEAWLSGEKHFFSRKVAFPPPPPPPSLGVGVGVGVLAVVVGAQNG